MLDYPAQEYWKRPAGKPRGESDVNAIFLSVGIALSRWEAVEQLFSWLFGYFVESPAQAATRAYGIVTANHSKRAMMDEAAQVFFRLRRAGEEFSKPLEKLLAHYGQAASRRGDIAHGMVMTFDVGGENLGSFLVPPVYNSRNTRAFAPQPVADNFTFSTVKYRYTSEEISQFTMMFNDLQQETMKYFGRLAKKYPQSQTVAS